MKGKKLKITEKYVQEFNERCSNFRAPEFLRFLTESDGNNVYYLDLIVQLENVIKLKPYKQEKKINFTIEEMTAIIEEFYSKLDKGDLVKSISNTYTGIFTSTQLSGETVILKEEALLSTSNRLIDIFCVFEKDESM